MSQVEHNIVINAPVEQVAAYVSDIRNAPSYIADIVATKSVSVPAGAQPGVPTVGTVAVFSFRFMGSVTDLDLRLDRYQAGPPTSVTLVNDQNSAVINLTATPLNASSCRLDAIISAPVAGFILNMMFGSSLQQGLKQLKQQIEQS